MKTYNITFSPTGGTEKVADLICEELSEEIIDISLLPYKTNYSEYVFSEDDLCVIAVPSYGGRVPKTAVSRIREMKGNGALCILICVYGNRAYEDTLLELKDTVLAADFFPIAAIAAVAEHSIMRQYGSGRPDQQDKEQLKRFAVNIIKKLEADEDLSEVEVPGNVPYREYGGVPFIPKPNRKCISCGKCARECPTGAINLNAPKDVDKKKCISCMRCISTCPLHCRGLNTVLLKAAAAKMAKVFELRKENELFI